MPVLGDMGHAFNKGPELEPVQCRWPRHGRVLIAKKCLRSDALKEMTQGFSTIVINESIQPGCAKGITVWHSFPVQFHKGYNVF